MNFGHNFYQRAYMDQPPLFQDSANDGSMKPWATPLLLSSRPEYLKQVGLLDNVPPESAAHRLPAQTGHGQNCSFLPFGLLDRQMALESFLR